MRNDEKWVEAWGLTRCVDKYNTQHVILLSSSRITTFSIVRQFVPSYATSATAMDRITVYCLNKTKMNAHKIKVMCKIMCMLGHCTVKCTTYKKDI